MKEMCLAGSLSLHKKNVSKEKCPDKYHHADKTIHAFTQTSRFAGIKIGLGKESP